MFFPKILTVCPTIRPSNFEIMKKSFYDTSSEGNVLYDVSHGTVTEAMNYAFNKFPNFDFYFMTNDDVEYKTHRWDKLLAKKGKITHGTDKVNIGQNGSFMMIDGDIVRSVGWLQLPTLNKYCGDTVWNFIGKQLEIIEYIPEVIINHNWEGANEEENIKDIAEFSKWLPWAFKDCNKIREYYANKSK